MSSNTSQSPSIAVIPVFHRSRYGITDTWCADPVMARHLTALTGARTLSHAHRCALESLGFTLTTVSDPQAQRTR